MLVLCYNDYSKLSYNLQIVENKGSLIGILPNITSKQRFPGVNGLLESPKGSINTQII